LPHFRPFKGIRYNKEKVPALSTVTAPPYDVIDEEGRRKLIAGSDHNIVRLILPEDEADVDRYTVAARLLERWLTEGVLVPDETPGIYVVSQAWSDGETTHRRTGFIAAVTLEPFGEGKIYPHESTLSGPKEDRLKLIKATRANLSQVFSLFPDENGDVDAWLRAATAGTPEAESTDDAGVVTKLWCEFDEDRIGELVAAMSDREIFIADGHHRYETALNYHRCRTETGGPADAIMMLCVAMNNEGLVTYPTHRLLPSDLVEPEALIQRLGVGFDVHPIATFSHHSGELAGVLESDTTPNVMALYVGKGRPPMRIRPKDGVELFPNTPSRSAAWQALDVSILQYAILERLLGLTLERVTSGARIGYVHDADEAVRKVDEGEFSAAFILRPTPVSAVARVASHLEKMPPKSTYFYPKALTGMVLRQLW